MTSSLSAPHNLFYYSTVHYELLCTVRYVAVRRVRVRLTSYWSTVRVMYGQVPPGADHESRDMHEPKTLRFHGIISFCLASDRWVKSELGCIEYLVLGRLFLSLTWTQQYSSTLPHAVRIRPDPIAYTSDLSKHPSFEHGYNSNLQKSVPRSLFSLASCVYLTPRFAVVNRHIGRQLF